MNEFYFLMLLISNICIASKLEDSVYLKFDNKALSYCNVRMRNDNLNTGCSTERNGNIGILLKLAQYNELNKTIDYDVIILVTIYEFINGIPDHILNNKYVKGIIVMRNSFDAYIPYSEYRKSGYDSLFPHLKIKSLNGNSNAFKNWPVPIVYIDDDDYINKTLECHNSSLETRQKCAIEIQNFATTRQFKDCHEKDAQNQYLAYYFNPIIFCKETEGMNYAITSSLDFTKQPVQNTIILYVRLDSLSMFDRSGFNNNGVIMSSSILMSVIKFLKASPAFTTPSIRKKDIIFMFLDNTARGNHTMMYFYDVLNNSTKNHKLFGLKGFDLSKVDFIMEIDELFRVSKEIELVYSKWNATTSAASKTTDVLRRMKKYLNRFNFAVTETGTNSQQNLNNKNADFPKSVVVLKNRGNNSDHVTNLTNALQSFLYNELVGKEVKLADYKDVLIDPLDIYNCFTSDLNCPLFLESFSSTFFNSLMKLSKLPVPTQNHVGSAAFPDRYRFSYLIKNPLITLSSPVIANLSICMNCKVNCTENYFVIKSVNGTITCYDVTKMYSGTLNSPVWLISDPVGERSVRLFYMDLYQGNGTLVLGIFITLVSIVSMLLLHPNINLLFEKSSID